MRSAAGPHSRTRALDRVAVAVGRSPKRVLAGITVGVVVLIAGLAPLAGSLGIGPFEAPDSSSVEARERIARATGAQPDAEMIALVKAAERAAVRRRTAAVLRVLSQQPSVATARTFAVGPRRAFVLARFRPGADDDKTATARRVRDRLSDKPGVALGGKAVATLELHETVERDLARAEMIAFPVLLLLLVVIFRGIVPALIPLAVGALTVGAAACLLGLVNQAVPISVFALNLVAGLGLGLAVDYSLLILARYREELAAGRLPSEAARRTVLTAGRTVLFSAATVAAAMASLLVFPLEFLYSMGIGGVLVTALSGLLAVTVLPASLIVVGRRVGQPRRIDGEWARGRWYHATRRVMQRPRLVAITVTGVLAVAALPYLGAGFTLADASALPSGSEARTVAAAVDRHLGPGAASPVRVVVQGVTGERRRIGGMRRSVAVQVDARVGRPRYLGASTWQFTVALVSPATSDAAQRVLHRVERALPPSAALVGGEAALYADLRDRLWASVPLALGLLVATTTVVLFLLTGSLVLPIKTLAMTVLSIGASFGLLVMLFQEGMFGLFDVSAGIELYQPFLLAALVFGLSTDYAVFLLARIKEFHDRGCSSIDAVSYGLQRTGRLVTAAALLFCVAVGTLASSRLGFVQQLAIGAALAVAIDATFIRGLLVPALMALLGRWNWWSPSLLRRFHDRAVRREAGDSAQAARDASGPPPPAAPLTAAAAAATNDVVASRQPLREDIHG